MRPWARSSCPYLLNLSTSFNSSRNAKNLHRRHLWRHLCPEQARSSDVCISSRGSRARCRHPPAYDRDIRSEEHTSELQSHLNLVCRLLLEKKKTLQQHLP